MRTFGGLVPPHLFPQPPARPPSPPRNSIGALPGASASALRRAMPVKKKSPSPKQNSPSSRSPSRNRSLQPGRAASTLRAKYTAGKKKKSKK